MCPGPDGPGNQVPDLGQGVGYGTFRSESGTPFLVLTAVRKTWASTERVMCGYQPVYCLTWCWFRPVWHLAV